MTHLNIIEDAYERCDILYVVLTGDSGHRYLILAGSKARMREIEAIGERATAMHPFMEFDRDGAIASY